MNGLKKEKKKNMSDMTSDRIVKAIQDADEIKSKLADDIFKLEGYSSAKVRCLLNNLVTSDDKYLEVGTWQGSTLISALYGNNVQHHLCIDDFSQFTDGNNIKEILFKNFQSVFNSTPNLIEHDAFTIDLSKINDRYTVYFYDGIHNEIAQRMALTYFYPILADEFILVVDDWSTGWGVEQGTREGIKKSNLTTVYEKCLPNIPGKHVEEWWNGLGVFILKK